MMPTFDRAGVRVTTVISRDTERSRRFASAFGIAGASNDLELLLEGGEIDAVYVANSSCEHAATAITALRGGKAVLCEKPLAMSIVEANQVADAARRTGSLCMEGLWIPFLPAYRRFLELARTNAFGQPGHLFANFGYPVSTTALPHMFTPAAGGVLLDRGIYLIALALNTLGPVDRVESLIELNDQGVDICASLQLFHRSGSQSQLAASFTTLMSNSATLACSEGLINLEEPLMGPEVISTVHVAVVNNPPQDPIQPLSTAQNVLRRLRRQPLLRRLKRAVPNRRREHLSYGLDPYLPQLMHFLARLRAGEGESDVIPLELSLSVQRVIDLARTAQRR